MQHLRDWATGHPLLFVLLFCVPVVLVAVTTALVLGEALNHMAGWGATGTDVGTTIGLILSAAFLIELLRRFQWLGTAGLVRPSASSWLLIVPPLLWVVSVIFYVSSGTFDLDFSDPIRSSLLIIRLLSTGLFEEIAFRGVILTAMLLAWAETRGGILKSFLLSSLLFGLFHLINLGSRDSVSVIANSVYTCFTGALFAGVALRCRSIWPAVLLHGVANALLSLNRLGETPPHWTATYAAIRIVAHLPLALYGYALLRGVDAKWYINLGKTDSIQ